LWYDAIVPRTTLYLEDDALEAARAHAARHGVSLGKAVSELVRQGAERPLVIDRKNGFPVVRLSGKSPKVTAELVNRLLEDWP
jgi:hypothetical protein